MCGAVTYAAEVQSELSACHCGMCLRWTGGPLLGVGVDNIAWQGEQHITTFSSSAWAERGFCSKCGSCLFYRVTAEGKFHGFLSITFGTLDDRSGLEVSKEWFIDKKPDAYTLAGDHKTVTEAEVMAMFASS